MVDSGQKEKRRKARRIKTGYGQETRKRTRPRGLPSEGRMRKRVVLLSDPEGEKVGNKEQRV